MERRAVSYSNGHEGAAPDIRDSAASGTGAHVDRSIEMERVEDLDSLGPVEMLEF